MSGRTHKDDSLASRLYRALNAPKRGRYQYYDGSYSEPIAITAASVSGHVAGSCTIAFSSSDTGLANFVAWSFRRRFEQRAVLFAESLESSNLLEASFAVRNGDGGTVVLTFREGHRPTQSDAAAFATRFLRSLRGRSGFGKRPADYVAYPFAERDGYVRLLGRDAHTGKSDVLTALDGESCRLTAIVGADASAVHRPAVRANGFAEQYAAIARACVPVQQSLLVLPHNRKNAATLVRDALAQYVTSRRQNPYCFPVTYQYIAELVGFDDWMRAREAVRRAEQQGLLLRIDSGEPNETRLSTLIGLVGVGQSQDFIYRRATATDEYARRQQERRDLGLRPARLGRYACISIITETPA